MKHILLIFFLASTAHLSANADELSMLSQEAILLSGTSADGIYLKSGTHEGCPCWENVELNMCVLRFFPEEFWSLLNGSCSDPGSGNFLGNAPTCDPTSLPQISEFTAPIPTLSQWGIIILFMILVIIGVRTIPFSYRSKNFRKLT